MLRAATKGAGLQEFGVGIVAAASDTPGRDLVGSPVGVFEQLGLLRASLLCDDGDLAEFRFSSHGDAAALYPIRRQSTSAFVRLFRAAPLGWRGEAILWSFLAIIPAERHFVRLGADTVSIFFKTDVPAQALARLCEPLGLPELASWATRLSETIASDPCGIAVEVSQSSRPRVRLYWHARSWPADMVSLARLAIAEFGLDRRCRGELARSWAGSTPEPERVVINLSAARGAVLALKIELPRVPISRARRLAGADHGASNAMQRALRLMREDSFSYVGLRWSTADEREATFYVDARPHLGSPRGGI
jgi:hypothetical protein